MRVSGLLGRVAFLTAAAWGVSAQTPSIPETLPKLVKMHRAWGTELSTNGAVLTLTVKQITKDGARIDLSTSGLASDGVYTLLSWPITEGAPQAVAEGVTLNSSGVPICSGRPGLCTRDKPDDPIGITLLSPLPGEPVRMALVSTDHKWMAFAKVVPVPLHGSDKDCTVDATLLTPGAEAVLYEASGFEPTAAIMVESVSESETRTDNKHADVQGHYMMVDLPYVTGHESGTVTLTLKSAKCAPSVTVAWGKR